MESTNDNRRNKKAKYLSLEERLNRQAADTAVAAMNHLRDHPMKTDDNHSGHIPCWTEPMEPRVKDETFDPAGQAAVGIQSAVSHLAERRIWGAVLEDKESAAQLMEDTGNLLLLMSALVRDLARR